MHSEESWGPGLSPHISRKAEKEGPAEETETPTCSWGQDEEQKGNAPEAGGATF